MLFISFRYGSQPDSRTFIQGRAPNGARGLLKLRKFLLFLRMNHIFWGLSNAWKLIKLWICIRYDGNWAAVIVWPMGRSKRLHVDVSSSVNIWIQQGAFRVNTWPLAISTTCILGLNSGRMYLVSCVFLLFSSVVAAHEQCCTMKPDGNFSNEPVVAYLMLWINLLGILIKANFISLVSNRCYSPLSWAMWHVCVGNTRGQV